ncbi:MAG: helicase C-terminal domain-containing protein, partial [Planctomycetota bacterium]
MQYLLTLYVDESGWDRMTPEQQQQGGAAYMAYTEALKSAGALVNSNRLRRSSTATTLRTTNGKTQVLDGPFAESKEQLAGYYLIEAPDLDAALQDLLEFSTGAEAWIVAEAEPVRKALQEAAVSVGFPGRLGPPVIGVDELAAVVVPTVGQRGLRDLAEHYGINGTAGVPPAPISAGETPAVRSGCAVLRELWARLEKDLLALPLPLLAEMNWLLAKVEGPLKKLIKKAEGEAVKDKFGDSFTSGKLSLDKLFKNFAELIAGLGADDEAGAGVSGAGPERPVTAQEVAALLGLGGPLAKELQGYEERREQIEMAERVAESLTAGKHLLAEAGTGVGKSLAYLVPAVLFSQRVQRPVMISTHTKNLQAQLFFKDLPLLHGLLGIKFETALLKGRPNYLCLHKLVYALQEAAHELDEEERVRMLPFMTWALQTETGDVSELARFSPEKDYALWDRLHTVGDDCLRRRCPFYNNCFVYKARALARRANVVVLNHALVFAELNLEAGSLPPYNEIVFDEAHKLEDVATDHLATEVTPRRLWRILNRLYRESQGSGAGKGLLPTLLGNLEQARGEVPKAVLEAAREHLLAAMQAVHPASEGSDSFFDTLRQWTEAPAAAEDWLENSAPPPPFVPHERGRGAPHPTLSPEGRGNTNYPGRSPEGRGNPNRPAFFLEGRGNTGAAFLRRKGPAGGENRKRFSAASLRADEKESFTQGKEAVIARLGLLRRALELLDGDFKELKKHPVARARDLATEIGAQNGFLEELIQDIEFIVKGDEPNYVYWCEQLGRRAVRAVAAPLDVSGLLHDQLYAKKRSIILTSATLSVRDAEAEAASGLAPLARPLARFSRTAGVSPRGSAGVSPAGSAGVSPAGSAGVSPATGAGGTPALPGAGGTPALPTKAEGKHPHPKSFEFLKNRLGLGLCAAGKLDELLLGSPFDYARQCRLWVPTFLPDIGSREKDFNAAFCSMAGELIIASGGRAMVLYTSWSALEASARVLRKGLASEGIEVLAQGSDGSRESLLARLQAGGRTALLGTASFWEGVDVRGAALSLLIIAKLPFAVFTDPIIQGRCELLEAKGKDAFLHFSVPNAILRLRQGFG